MRSSSQLVANKRPISAVVVTLSIGTLNTGNQLHSVVEGTCWLTTHNNFKLSVSRSNLHNL